MNRGVVRCGGPVTRRGFLRVGALGLVGGLGVGDLLRLRAATAAAAAPTGGGAGAGDGAGAASGPDTAVIFLWLPGGPPHMETYDMKPDAPSEYGGVFSPSA